jgi:hypothetical protein
MTISSEVRHRRIVPIREGHADEAANCRDDG